MSDGGQVARSSGPEQEHQPRKEERRSVLASCNSVQDSERSTPAQQHPDRQQTRHSRKDSGRRAGRSETWRDRGDGNRNAQATARRGLGSASGSRQEDGNHIRNLTQRIPGSRREGDKSNNRDGDIESKREQDGPRNHRSRGRGQGGRFRERQGSRSDGHGPHSRQRLPQPSDFPAAEKAGMVAAVPATSSSVAAAVSVTAAVPVRGFSYAAALTQSRTNPVDQNVLIVSAAQEHATGVSPSVCEDTPQSTSILERNDGSLAEELTSKGGTFINSVGVDTESHEQFGSNSQAVACSEPRGQTSLKVSTGLTPATNHANMLHADEYLPVEVGKVDAVLSKAIASTKTFTVPMQETTAAAAGPASLPQAFAPSAAPTSQPSLPATREHWQPGIPAHSAVRPHAAAVHMPPVHHPAVAVAPGIPVQNQQYGMPVGWSNNIAYPSHVVAGLPAQQPLWANYTSHPPPAAHGHADVALCPHQTMQPIRPSVLHGTLPLAGHVDVHAMSTPSLPAFTHPHHPTQPPLHQLPPTTMRPHNYTPAWGAVHNQPAVYHHPQATSLPLPHVHTQNTPAVHVPTAAPQTTQQPAAAMHPRITILQRPQQPVPGFAAAPASGGLAAPPPQSTNLSCVEPRQVDSPAPFDLPVGLIEAVAAEAATHTPPEMSITADRPSDGDDTHLHGASTSSGVHVGTMEPVRDDEPVGPSAPDAVPVSLPLEPASMPAPPPQREDKAAVEVAKRKTWAAIASASTGAVPKRAIIGAVNQHVPSPVSQTMQAPPAATSKSRSGAGTGMGNNSAAAAAAAGGASMVQRSTPAPSTSAALDERGSVIANGDCHADGAASGGWKPDMTEDQRTTLSDTPDPPSWPHDVASTALTSPNGNASPQVLEVLHNLGHMSSAAAFHNTRSRLPPRGLVNAGNLCFMNATLQALMGAAPFCHLMQALVNLTAVMDGSETPTLEAFSSLAVQYDPQLGGKSGGDGANTATDTDGTDQKKSNGKAGSVLSKNKAINPTMLTGVLREFIRNHSGSDVVEKERTLTMAERLSRQNADLLFAGKLEQQDAQEFFTFLFDRAHQELVRLQGRDKAPSTSVAEDEVSAAEEEAHGEWITMGKKNRTAFTRGSDLFEGGETAASAIFGGGLQSTVRCAGLKPSETVQPFTVLHLDIHPERVLSIQDALELFTAPETIQGYKGKGGEETQATKFFRLRRLPLVLVLHLKRFTWMHGTGKLHKTVKFDKTLRLQPQWLADGRCGVAYELIATVSHHGRTPSSGHYTADVQQADGKWLRFDDATVSYVSESDVFSSKVYLLFYQMLGPQKT